MTFHPIEGTKWEYEYVPTHGTCGTFVLFRHRATIVVKGLRNKVRPTASFSVGVDSFSLVLGDRIKARSELTWMLSEKMQMFVTQLMLHLRQGGRDIEEVLTRFSPFPVDTEKFQLEERQAELRRKLMKRRKTNAGFVTEEN